MNLSHSFSLKTLNFYDASISSKLELLCGACLQLLKEREKLALLHIFFCYLHASIEIKDYTLSDALFDAIQSATVLEKNQRVCQIVFLLENTSRRNILEFARLIAVKLTLI